MIPASTIPMITATAAMTAGLPVSSLTGRPSTWVTPARPPKVRGR
jgi:hypothetical protein